jgi:hypothetical protein
MLLGFIYLTFKFFLSPPTLNLDQINYLNRIEKTLKRFAWTMVSVAIVAAIMLGFKGMDYYTTTLQELKNASMSPNKILDTKLFCETID